MKIKLVKTKEILMQIKHKEKSNDIREFRGCTFIVMVVQVPTTTP